MAEDISEVRARAVVEEDCRFGGQPMGSGLGREFVCGLFTQECYDRRSFPPMAGRAREMLNWDGDLDEGPRVPRAFPGHAERRGVYARLPPDQDDDCRNVGDEDYNTAPELELITDTRASLIGHVNPVARLRRQEKYLWSDVVGAEIENDGPTVAHDPDPGLVCRDATTTTTTTTS